MTRLQEDLLGIYNSLTDFSNETLGNKLPLLVDFSEGLNSLCFSQRGKSIAISSLNYYCLDLPKVKGSYLIPEDYDYLMSSLAGIIGSGALLRERVCLSPEKYGFKIYETSSRYIKEGPQLLADISFVSGNSWLFKKIMKIRYERI